MSNLHKFKMAADEYHVVVHLDLARLCNTTC